MSVQSFAVLGQTPVESTADTQRFRMVLPRAKETVFEVRELRQGETQIMVGDVDEILLAQLAKSGISAASLEKALKPISTRKPSGQDSSGIERPYRASATPSDRIRNACART